MKVLLQGDEQPISSSHLLSAILRLDLIPVPASLELILQRTQDLQDKIQVGKRLMVAHLPIEFVIVKVTPLSGQHIKDGQIIGVIGCIAIPSGCESLIQASSRAIILNNTSFNNLYRVLGVKVATGDDIPIQKFVCLRGQMPTERIALCLQEEACVIRLLENKICVKKLDDLFKQDVKFILDAATVAWVSSKHVENMLRSNFLTIASDGSTVIMDDGQRQMGVTQRAGLDSRRIKNLNKVLITRGVIVRTLNPDFNAGDLIEIESKKYVILTVAHIFKTGSLGDESVSASKLWIASL